MTPPFMAGSPGAGLLFKTKHMITLAKVALDESIPMLFVVPESYDFDMSSPV